MKSLPHRYQVTVAAGEQGAAEVSSRGLYALASAPPEEFGGPGNLWSPETLLVAAAVDCFVLTFRGIATASRFHWANMVCEGEGVLDRSDGNIGFTSIHLRVRLVLPFGADINKARRLLEKAEKGCLVSNSLKFAPTVEAEITVGEHVLAPTG